MSARPQIVMLGDSIRLGYETIVREQLADVADIWSPENNCEHSLNHLIHFHAWYVERQPALIHFNFGLWDCRRLNRENLEIFLPVEVFARNLECCLQGVRRWCPQTKIVWATITPVIEQRHRQMFCKPADPYRVAQDIDLYNRAAEPVLRAHAVVVNDLGGLLASEGLEPLIGPDGVHLTEQGNAVAGKATAQLLRAQLAYV